MDIHQPLWGHEGGKLQRIKTFVCEASPARQPTPPNRPRQSAGRRRRASWQPETWKARPRPPPSVVGPHHDATKNTSRKAFSMILVAVSSGRTEQAIVPRSSKAVGQVGRSESSLTSLLRCRQFHLPRLSNLWRSGKVAATTHQPSRSPATHPCSLFSERSENYALTIPQSTDTLSSPRQHPLPFRPSRHALLAVASRCRRIPRCGPVTPQRNSPPSDLLRSKRRHFTVFYQEECDERWPSPSENTATVVPANAALMTMSPNANWRIAPSATARCRRTPSAPTAATTKGAPWSKSQKNKPFSAVHAAFCCPRPGR